MILDMHTKTRLCTKEILVVEIKGKFRWFFFSTNMTNEMQSSKQQTFHTIMCIDNQPIVL